MAKRKHTGVLLQPARYSHAGAWIEWQRPAARVTQAQLADGCGYERGSLWQVIQGFEAPGMPLIVELAQVLRGDAHEILVLVGGWRLSPRGKAALTEVESGRLSDRTPRSRRRSWGRMTMNEHAAKVNAGPKRPTNRG